MSCYEYEYGSIKLPSAEFSRVRRAFAEQHNLWLDAISRKADSHYEPLKAYISLYKKDKSVVVWSTDRVCGLVNKYLSDKISGLTEAELSKLVEVFLSSKTVDGKVKYSLSKPKKSDFKHVSLSNNEYQDDEASITLDATNKTLEWHVQENNHAVERARKGELGIRLHKILNSVKWTRSTGGVFYYNNEYNREDEGFCGAGGDQDSHHFGPIGDQHKKDKIKSLNQMVKRFR